VSISIIACSDTEIALAPPLFDERHFRAPRGLEIDVVVAGAEQLHELRASAPPCRIVPHRNVRIGDHVLDAGQVGDDLGIVVNDDCLEPLRRHIARDVGDLGGGQETRILGAILPSGIVSSRHPEGAKRDPDPYHC
jgi:hypothetical protein